MSDHEHASLPVVLASLTHLTNDELHALKAKFASSAKEARRKANLAIGKVPDLKKPWQRTLATGRNTPTDERAAIFSEFERELLRAPEAYIAHAFANSLILLEEECRKEMLRRSMSAPAKGKAAPPPAPEAPVEGPLDAAFRNLP